MSQIETYNHLYCRPQYSVMGGEWYFDYKKSLEEIQNLTIDKVGICSFLSLGQFSKNRTLFKEVKRLEWLSEPMPNGESKNLIIPEHGLFTSTTEVLSKMLFEKLCNEARKVILYNPNIYILLTGGLDSRIIAGIFSYLYKNGELKNKPKCLTWGIEDSRDVFYAKKIAKALNFDWSNIPLGPEDVIENINKCGEYLGMLHSPEMLHSMLWFKNLPSDAMVIAGSFGDSIGRAEFSNFHLLQLDYKKPNNSYNILTPLAYKDAAGSLNLDLDHIHSRGNTSFKYAQCEYWMQGYRMRNGLCHALSVINKYANIYQMFTDPEVYSFIWSLHPSRRDDDIYTNILKEFFPELAVIPWARNNKAIDGAYKEKKLKPHYHDYTKWSSGVLYDHIKSLVDPDWFAQKGIFNPSSILKMNDLVFKSKERVGRLNDIWLWLAGFRYYIDKLEAQGKVINFEPIENDEIEVSYEKTHSIKYKAILLASKSEVLNKSLRSIRKEYRSLNLKKEKKKMLAQYPPKLIIENN